MTRRKKLLIYALLALVVLATIAYFAINIALERASRRALAKLEVLARQQGIEVVDPSFQSVRMSGFPAATWANVRAGLKLPQGGDPDNDRLWDTQGDQLEVEWSLSGRGTLVADRVVINGVALNGADAGNQDAHTPADRRIELQDVRFQFDMELFDPAATLGRLLPEFSQLTSAAKSKLPFELTGKLTFTLKGEPAELRMFVERVDGVYAVLLDPADVAPLSERFDEKLTEAEVKLVAAHPLRAIHLLDIKNRAESTSERAHEQDASIPQDAYRHVLWSFLLTKAYGAEFAEQVGDAHEAGDTGNTPAERQMDLHNNAIGRKYAGEDIEEKAILPRLLDDPDVVREP